MDLQKMKAAAEWFRSKVFQDEAIRPRKLYETEQPSQPAAVLPAVLRAARSLESGPHREWQSRESVFMKQAKLLAAYEDDWVYRGTARHYYTTYQSLSDDELRGYFSWRTKVRRGDIQKTSLSFAFLYVYELLNQIGLSDPMDGYRKLLDFQTVYGSLDSAILQYLKLWLVDYVVYYELDPALLADTPQVIFDQSVTILEQVRERDTGEVMGAVKRLEPKWMERSRFYAAYPEDMDTVTVRVLRRVSDHYASRCKKTMVEQYFGMCDRYPIHLFSSAIFCDPLNRKEYEYKVDEQWTYQCAKGLWTVRKRGVPTASSAPFRDLLKTIDCIMRQEYHYKYPTKQALETKWILRIIQEEVRNLLSAKQAEEEKKITIDYSRLTKIRRDAAITQEKLIVEEEMDQPEKLPPEPEEPAVSSPAQPVPEEGAPSTPLRPEEYRLLQCLLYGGDCRWVQAEGFMMSVLVDGVNEKLYDVFLDSVLDDTPQLIEDYIDELKEMVHP